MEHDEALSCPDSAETQTTQAQIEAAVMDYLLFEYDTSLDYPFRISPQELDTETMAQIAALCNGFDDTETIHEACTQVIGSAETAHGKTLSAKSEPVVKGRGKQRRFTR